MVFHFGPKAIWLPSSLISEHYFSALLDYSFLGAENNSLGCCGDHSHYYILQT
jgi:hypothetical protein